MTADIHLSNTLLTEILELKSQIALLTRQRQDAMDAFDMVREFALKHVESGESLSDRSQWLAAQMLRKRAEQSTISEDIAA